MKKRRRSAVIAAVLLIAIAVLAGACALNEDNSVVKPKLTSRKSEGKGYRFESNGWIYLHLEGSPYEVGYQNGKLMAGQMDKLRRGISRFAYADSGLKWSHMADAAEAMFSKTVEPEYMEEMRGISEGATAAGIKFTLPEVLALNGNIELASYWWPLVQSGKLEDLDTPTRCSAFLATGKYTKDGLPVMAHNTWSGYLDGQYANVLVDLEPASGHHIFMQGVPGCIFSQSDFFVTDAPMMGTETTISGIEEFDPAGKPAFSRARKAMQYSNSLDDFVAIMRDGNNGAYANSWLLADPRNGEIMRFEQGYEHDAVERTKDGYYTGFNAPSDMDLRVLESKGAGYSNIKDSSGARRVRLDQLMDTHKGKIDTAAARAIIADHYDVYTSTDAWGDRTIEGRSDLDSKEFTQGSPYFPWGAVDGKAMDSPQALSLSFEARWGSSSGLPFDAGQYFNDNPQYDMFEGYIIDRPTQHWALFGAGMK